MNEPRGTRRTFLAAHTADSASAPVAIAGLPFDGAVTFRAGAADGPPAIRAASDSIETYCPRFRDDLSGYAIDDVGDVQLPPRFERGADAVATMLAELQPRCGHARVLALGGDHLVAYPVMQRVLSRYPALQVVHLDAHGDLRTDWDGDPFNHSTVLGRVLDTMGPDASIHRAGIRSGTRAEFELAAGDPRIIDYRSASAIAEGLDRDRPTYITFDVDGLDPSEFPGTGTPEPGGLRFADVEALLCAIDERELNVVGADLVECAPSLDPAGYSVVTAARIVRSLALLLSRAAKRHGPLASAPN